MNGGEATALVQWIKSDPVRWELLGHVRSLALPDCWIAAGFVRNCAWDVLHGFEPQLSGDVDVIWFDASDASETNDHAQEERLRDFDPTIGWSVKNQARMHTGNGDAPYTSSVDAMRYWPETSTAVAVRRTNRDTCELIAPFGLEDLLSLTLRPAGEFAGRKRMIFDDRVRRKQWLLKHPRLQLAG